MSVANWIRIASICLGLLLLSGCGEKPVSPDKGAPAKEGGEPSAGGSESTGGRETVIGYSFPVEAGKYTILDILTDGKSGDRAKKNAEDTLVAHDDIACMVGLWAYNPPAILQAVEAAGKAGEVKIVGFDEQNDTLQGIAEGKIVGTIVQQPFYFGYKSVEYLAAMARGQEVAIPESKMMYAPFEVITQDNVAAFTVDVQNKRDGKGTPPEHRMDYDTSTRVTVAFLTNSVDPFWDLAERGCELAGEAFNAEVIVKQPPSGTVEEQQRFMEDMITQNAQGLAISPIDAANQVAIIDRVCEVMPVIAQDSDAPATRRKFYLGTSNYLAGRAAGKLVREACPQGGKVMIFVGKLEVINAQERSRGVIDELAGKPLPPEFADQAP